jgi:hypothetical protein
MPMLKVYCNTNTLAPNIRDDPSELAALEWLRELRRAGKISMYRSRSVEGETDRTPDPELRERLKADYELLDRVLKDEKVLGFYTTYDHAGGAITNPLVADVQNENMYGEIYEKHKRHSPKEPEASRRGDVPLNHLLNLGAILSWRRIGSRTSGDDGCAIPTATARPLLQ